MNGDGLVSRLSACLQQNGPAAGYLLLCVVNYAQLLQAYAQDGLPSALLAALKQRMAPYGVDDDDVLMLDYFVLARISDAALERMSGDSSFPENIGQALSYAPVRCGEHSILLRLHTVWLGSEASAEPGPPFALADLRAAAGAVAFAEAELATPEQIRRDMAWACRLLRKLQSGEVALAFQPVVPAQESGDLQYYEALLRCAVSKTEGGDGYFPSSGKLAATLERLHLIERLDASVLLTVMQVLQQYPDVSLGCNLSPLSLRRSGWLRSIFATLSDNPDLARRLTLEITETACIVDLDEVSEVLQPLRDLGCRIALDDLGAGFNTLELVAQLRPDIVKLDKSLLHGARGLCNVRDLNCLVDALRPVCRYVVAEGIESQEDLNASLHAEAHAVQGYFIGKPSLQPSWLSTPAFVADFFKPVDRAMPAAIYAPGNRNILNPLGVAK